MSTEFPSLKGKLLLAMPQIDDERFEKAVIFICTHDETGAMGITINHPLPGWEFRRLLDQLKIEPQGTVLLDETMLSTPILSGGPVERTRGFLLHTNDYKQHDTTAITPEFSMTGTLQAIKALAEGDGPQKYIFAMGYAGWTAGQLEDELQKNVWLVAEASTAIVYDTPLFDKWDATMAALGIDPALLGSAGNA
ncbi:MAG: hypothetical protein GC136_04130 [Alphaproteobacteria bacterium]|nr:hypothetical protein [Alphaproteobacteria bacterium]